MTRACPSIPLSSGKLETLQAALVQVDEVTERHEAATVAAALEMAKASPERILVVGSLFLAGELLAGQADAAAELQRSAQ